TPAGYLDSLWFLPIVPAYLLILGPKIFPGFNTLAVFMVILAGALIEAGLITIAVVRYRRKRNRAIKLLAGINGSLAIYGYRLRRCYLKDVPRGDPQVCIVLTDLLDASVERRFAVSGESVWSFKPLVG